MAGDQASSRLETFLIVSTSYCLVLNILFLVLFVRRVLKMDKMGNNLAIATPRSTWVKFSLIITAMLLCAVHILLSYNNPNYWLNANPNYSLTALAYLANYTLQLHIVLRQVKKSLLRYKPNAIYWTLCFIIWLIETVVVELILAAPNASITLQVALCLINAALALIAVLFEKIGRESTSSVKEQLFGQSEYRSAESSFARSQRHSRSNRFFVDFNREFQVTEKKTGLLYRFKFAVYLDQSVTIVTRSEHDFHALEEQLLKLFPQNPTIELPPLKSSQENIMQMGEQRRQRYENYLIDLLRCEQFYVPCLLEFLQVPPNMRGRLLQDHKGLFHKQQTLYSEEEEGIRVPFFKVQMQARGRVLISNPDVLELQVNKKPKEILEFHHHLLEEKRLTMEMLTDTLESSEVVHFFEIVVNRKQLWRAFAGWMGLGSQIENKIAAYFDLWTFGFKNVTVEVIGNEKNFDREGRIFTQYLISIQRKVPRGERQDNNVILKKRYSDFYTMNREVNRFISKHKLAADHLPDMPPKVSPFGSKTSPKSRQVRFDLYIKELVRIEGINHCVKLLEFLEVDAPSQPQVYEPESDQAPQFFEHSEKSYFSDLSHASHTSRSFRGH